MKATILLVSIDIGPNGEKPPKEAKPTGAFRRLRGPLLLAVLGLIGAYVAEPSLRPVIELALKAIAGENVPGPHRRGSAPAPSLP